MRKSLSILIIAIVLTNLLQAQSFRQLIKNGNKSFEVENYEASEYYFSKAIQISETPPVAWKLAEAARMNRDYNIAQKWYQYTTDNDLKKYPLSTFWLATVEKSIGSYQKAQLNYRKYFIANIKAKDYYTEKARHEIASCENALFLTFNPVETPFNRLDTTINSQYSEFQIADLSDSLKYLTSLRPINNNDSTIFYSKLLLYTKIDSAIFNKSVIDTNINLPNKNISSFTFVTENSKIIFSACDRKKGKFYCQLYQSEKINDQWVSPSLLPDFINSKVFTTTNPCFAKTPKGSYLLYASDKDGGYGKLDLWYSKIDSVGNYTEPNNLGKNINSIDDECCPFYDNKTQTLYFSSEWFDNLGNTDIFSVQGNIEDLKYPQNIGFPLNSCNYDVYYNISTNRNFAYFSSNRTLDRKASTAGCCNDIFQIILPKEKNDSVTDKKIEAKLIKKSVELIPISLYFHNDEPNPRTWDTTTNLNYATTAEKYISMREEYQNMWSQNLKDEAKGKALTEIENFFIDSVEKNFDKLVKFTQLMEQLLEKGQNIEITIKGYASPLNSNAYNTNLSKRRTQSLVNFFNEYQNGIFIPYINGNSSNGAILKITREAFGEEMVVKGVSDNLYDTKNSVYSPAAACERKIAVIAVAFSKN